MKGLYGKTRDLDGDLYRNIVSLRQPEDLFDDLSGGDPELSALACEAEMRIRGEIPTGIIHRGLHYTTAIGYPFETEPFMASRYGDGTYGLWYGALELETSIYETVYHTVLDIAGIEGVDEPVYRERAVYLVHCRALLIDLSAKRKEFPLLVADEYAFTQEIGRRIHREGHPGLLAPSARCAGTSAVIFNEAVLHSPRPHCFLGYRFDPGRMEVAVEREPGQVLQVIDARPWAR
ncbi:hypothetical protein DESUT3_33010 [Desulfuromonas versatilis]|uniref:RES domain-containing protein n=1 Tax=Desulfuromonas versatilis TaxID=2802975 RepID=A0ABM8I064_9BACT|nr:RES family NAD+ phosphorylase [Desulfuromonas versatilis]BCR06232.1 hypothetical protein DESUT3_33010 [Desulfuromonas versatilis]